MKTEKGNLVNRNKSSLFKKRHYVSMLKRTVEYCTLWFGYKTKPFLFESVNKDGELMIIYPGRGGRRYAIFYDYMQFKRVFGHLDFEGQEAYAMFLSAHEMYHYYQMRQLSSKNPQAPQWVLDEWRENNENPQFPEDCSILEFYLQPMELDAELFAYTFVADHLGVRVNLNDIDDNYIDVLEKRYIKLFDETSEELFPKD